MGSAAFEEDRSFLSQDLPAAAVVCRTEHGNLHAGFLYRDRGDVAVLHLGWQDRLFRTWSWPKQVGDPGPAGRGRPPGGIEARRAAARRASQRPPGEDLACAGELLAGRTGPREWPVNTRWEQSQTMSAMPAMKAI